LLPASLRVSTADAWEPQKENAGAVPGMWDYLEVLNALVGSGASSAWAVPSLKPQPPECSGACGNIMSSFPGDVEIAATTMAKTSQRFQGRQDTLRKFYARAFSGSVSVDGLDVADYEEKKVMHGRRLQTRDALCPKQSPETYVTRLVVLVSQAAVPNTVQDEWRLQRMISGRVGCCIEGTLSCCANVHSPTFHDHLGQKSAILTETSYKILWELLLAASTAARTPFRVSTMSEFAIKCEDVRNTASTGREIEMWCRCGIIVLLLLLLLLFLLLLLLLLLLLHTSWQEKQSGTWATSTRRSSPTQPWRLRRQASLMRSCSMQWQEKQSGVAHAWLQEIQRCPRCPFPS